VLLLCVGTGSQVRAETLAAVNTDRVNARGQASIFSEVVTQLRQGDVVTVLEVIKLRNPRAGEPAEWVRIQIPTNTLVWVHASYVDPVAKVVLANKLNVRAGPGQSYSVVGSLAKGESVQETRTVDQWMEIERPANCWAFISGSFLNRAIPQPTTSTNAPPAPPPVPATQPSSSPDAAPPPPVAPGTPVPTNTPTTNEGRQAESTAAPPGIAPAPATTP
jgi:SH3-like domain-containing protein